jgi:hypothetical protein
MNNISLFFSFLIIFIIVIYLFYVLNHDIFDEERVLKLTNLFHTNLPISNKFQNQIWINDMNKNGAIVIPNILSPSDCHKILKIIATEKKNSNLFTHNIRSNKNREYIMLPLEKTLPFVKKIYLKLKHFCDTLLPDSKLLETSSFTTFKGAVQQRFHNDGDIPDPNDNAFTFGIALDDFTENMGPLEYYAKSHKKTEDTLLSIAKKYNLPHDPYTSDDEANDDPSDGYKYNIFEEACKKINLPKIKCTCKKGALTIWSWKVFHRGGENTNKKRPMFYFSLKNNKLSWNDDDVKHTLKKKNNLTYIVASS